MKKYLRLGCTVCKRVTDRAVDNERYTPDKCTITLRCQGRLLPLEYRSNVDIANTPQVGITDWYPRNTKVNTPSTALQEATFVNTSTGSTQQLVLAIAMPAPPSDTATAVLTLNVRSDSPKNFRQYTYRLDATFSTIAGVETAPAKKTLRYVATGANPDIVEVFVNGIKQEEGTDPDQYQIYRGSVPPAENTILFNAPVSVLSSTQVDVIVSKAQQASNVQISFFKNKDTPARTETGAWENVDSFDRFVDGSWKTFYLFTYDVKNNIDLAINTIMIADQALPIVVSDGGTTNVDVDSAFFMLAREPYLKVDRYPDIVVPLSGLSTERDYLKYLLVAGTPTLQVTETSLTAAYPPARLNKSDPDPRYTTNLGGSEGQITVDGSVIIGPDT